MAVGWHHCGTVAAPLWQLGGTSYFHAVAQNRQHKAHKERLVSKLNQIQNECRQAVQYGDPEKRSDALFKVFFEFATALKLFAEMSSNINSISTIGVLDTESIKKSLQKTP